MSDKRVTRRVVIKRPKNRLSVSFEDLLSVKKWILTGSFNNVIDSDINKIDHSKIHLIKRLVFSDPLMLNRELLNLSRFSIKKKTVFIVLILLSSGNFNSKKVFKTSFNKIVKTPNDLYLFLSMLKKYRGFGSLIHSTIKSWIKSKSVHSLEKMFLEENAKYNWSSQDVIRMIKPKPRDRKENLLFKWIANKGINESDLFDYKEHLPLIYYYEKIKNGSIIEIKNNEFSKKMIPTNYYNKEKNFMKTYDTDESLLFSFKRERVNHNEDILIRLDDIIRKKKIKLSILDLVSVKESMVENCSDKALVNKIDKLISDKVNESIKSHSKTIHIIDTSNNMFDEKNNFFKLSDAIITSIVTCGSDNIFTFSGKKLSKRTERSILECEAPQEEFDRIIKINKRKINESINFIPKHIFIWTNVKYLNDVEKEADRLKRYFGNSKVCLINLGDKKLFNKNPNFYIINGFNKKTEKIIKLIEDDIILS